MSRHFCLSSELSGAIAKIPPHAKNKLAPISSELRWKYRLIMEL